MIKGNQGNYAPNNLSQMIKGNENLYALPNNRQNNLNDFNNKSVSSKNENPSTVEDQVQERIKKIKEKMVSNESNQNIEKLVADRIRMIKEKQKNNQNQSNNNNPLKLTEFNQNPSINNNPQIFTEFNQIPRFPLDRNITSISSLENDLIIENNNLSNSRVFLNDNPTSRIQNQNTQSNINTNLRNPNEVKKFNFPTKNLKNDGKK